MSDRLWVTVEYVAELSSDRATKEIRRRKISKQQQNITAGSASIAAGRV